MIIWRMMSAWPMIDASIRACSSADVLARAHGADTRSTFGAFQPLNASGFGQ